MTTWDEDFDTVQDRVKGPSLMTWLIAGAVGSFLVWASFAPLDEIVRANGSVVAGDRPQIVQNLEGGILAEMLVAQGDAVEPGQVLARLQGTQFQAEVQDLSARIDAAEIRRLRLEAEMAGQDTFTVPEPIAARAPEMVASEAALLAARMADVRTQTEGALLIYEETRRELAVMEDLHARGIAALIEVTRARKANTDAEARHNAILSAAELDRATAYSEVLQEISTLTAELRLARDRLERTEILSPMRGVVNEIRIATIGGVVRPGEEIFEITPAGEALFVEARVRPQDIANVVVGQEATIKLSAYDYTIWGALSGEVAFVSADTVEDDRRADVPPYYRVTVAVDLSHPTERQQGIEIRPGMQASVELHTGEKTVLHYLVKPLMRGSEALREP